MIVHNWAKRSAHKEHLGKMIFFNRNKKKYEWDNEDLSDVTDLTEDNPNVHNDLSAELPGVDLEADSSVTTVVSPAVTQSDAECVQTAIENIVLIDRFPSQVTYVIRGLDQDFCVCTYLAITQSQFNR